MKEEEIQNYLDSVNKNYSRDALLAEIDFEERIKRYKQGKGEHEFYFTDGAGI